MTAAMLACESSSRRASPSAADRPQSSVKAAPAPVDPRRCKPAPGASGSPNTIEEAVSLANSLPFPVTAECFVEALDRPLKIEATKSTLSVQPAHGERSPRVFVWSTDALVSALVIDGPHRDLVEFSQFITPQRSVKAELHFPLTVPATVAGALDHVRNAEHPRITRCFVCHDRERDEPTIPGGRSSLALRPSPSSLVDLAQLRREHETCDDTTEPDRCRWLAALLDHGPVEHRPFDRDLRLF